MHTWEYEAPTTRRTFRAASLFFDKLDAIPLWEIGKYLGSVPEDALADYVSAVLEVTPQFFNSAKDDRAARALNILELGDGQPLIFPRDPFLT